VDRAARSVCQPHHERVIANMMWHGAAQPARQARQHFAEVFGALLLGLAFVLAAHQVVRAEAAPYRMGVLELESDDLDDSFARSFAERLRAAISARHDIQLVPTHVSLAQLSLAQNCDTAETACLARIARGLDVDGFVFGKVTRDRGKPSADLQRYDLAEETVEGMALASFTGPSANAAELERTATTMVSELYGEAEAPVEPPPVMAKPRAAVANLRVPVVQARVEPSGISARRVASYALIGGAVVSAGLSVFSFVQVDHAQHNANYQSYRMAVGQNNPMARDVCSEANAGRQYGLASANFHDAKSACSTGSLFEVLQYVFLGTTVLTGGLATYLLASDSPERARARLDKETFTLRPTPNIAAKSLTLTARLRF
jgi:hypothetical protein